MATRVEYRGQGYHWRSIEAISDSIGATLLIFDVQVELLQVCGPILVAIILQISLCLHEL